MVVFFVGKRLAFGSKITAKIHVKRLRALGVTHVVNLRRVNNAKIKKFIHLWLPFKDDKKPRPRWFYKRALKFYRKAMKKREPKLYVMCQYGICRSASLAYFLLRCSGKSQNKAERRITKARPTARVVPAYRESGEKYLKRIKQRENI